MTEARPFDDLDHLNQTAERFWWALCPEDWLEAFSAHPKIGERKAVRETTFAQKWSAQEQSGVRSATQDTLVELADLNNKYLDRFGYIFIVCATGKSPGEMLSILRDRLGNDEHKELRVAALEQAAITRLRLEKLLTQ